MSHEMHTTAPPIGVAVIAVLAAALMSVGFAGCGGPGGDEVKEVVVDPDPQGFQFEIRDGSDFVVTRVFIRHTMSLEMTEETVGLSDTGRTTHFMSVPDIGNYWIMYYWRRKNVIGATEKGPVYIKDPITGSWEHQIRAGEITHVGIK